MKAISSAATAVIIATISISLIGSYFLSKRIMGPTELERLGIDITQAETMTGVSCNEVQANCADAGNTCRGGGQCTNSGICPIPGCPGLPNSYVTGNNCSATYNAGCKYCDKGIGQCALDPTADSCTESGSCDYDCNPDWYDDDSDFNNGCENAPPRYSNPIGSNSPNPNPGDTVYHWVNWEDINGASLNTSILEVNGSGANCDQTVNVSFYGLSGTSDIANISWQVGSNCGGKTISWRIYANDSANRWNVSELQTYTVQIPPTDLSFNITLPGLDPIESSETRLGTMTTPLEFNATAKTDYDVVPCVYGYGCDAGYVQDGTTPIFIFTNTGNTAEKWNISLSQALPSYIHLYGDIDNSRIGATEITTSGWTTANNILVGDYVEVWLWADFVDALPGQVDIAINHTSMSTT